MKLFLILILILFALLGFYFYRNKEGYVNTIQETQYPEEGICSSCEFTNLP